MLLTDTAGLHTADPRRDSEAARVARVEDFAELDAYEIGDRRSLYGSGGMRSKVSAAGMASAAGIPAVICDGTESGSLLAAARGEDVGTAFAPHPERTPSFKLWLRYAKPARGRIAVDAGAARVLRESGSSLLPVGIVGVEGEFAAGDAVDVVADDGPVGKGIANYSAAELARIKGMKSAEVLGAVAERLRGGRPPRSVRARVSRLDPAVFNLPVERLRCGHYSDAYFNHTKELLEAEGRHPRVLMQVFQRHESVLGGIDEAIAVVKLGSGRRRENGTWEPGWPELEVRALEEGDAVEPVGDRDDDRRRLLAVRPPGDGLPRVHGPALARDAQRAGGGGGRRRQADRLLPGAPRPLAGTDGRRLGRARRRGDRGVHRRPGVVVGRARGGHGPARPDRRIRGRHRRRGPGLRPAVRRPR